MKNGIRYSGDVAFLRLNRGGTIVEAMIDREDVELVAAHSSWRIDQHGAVVANDTGERLHIMLTGVKATDFANGNYFDFRRSNLITRSLIRIKGKVAYVRMRGKRRKWLDEEVMIDAEDVPRIKGFWRLLRGKGGSRYAVTTVGEDELLFLHRLIMNTPDNQECRFLDGNTRDCRKMNLLNCDHETTMAGRGRRSWKPTSGENWIHQTIHGTYEVYCSAFGKAYWYGTHKTLSEAKKARDRMQREIEGRLRQMKEQEQKGGFIA